MSNSLAERVEANGFAIVNDVVDAAVVERLCEDIERVPDGDAVRSRQSMFGMRNVLDLVPSARELSRSKPIREIAEAVLGPNCFAVRATLFNKVDGANWKLGWHRDQMIAVQEPHEMPDGYRAWSLKADVWHVRPPDEVLASMLAVRVHLDDCPAENGALRVIAGSHDQSVEPDRSQATVCELSAGGVLAMRPLLMHASSSATTPRQRRVIHIEFAANDLPGAVEWYDRIA